jgi:hypothetical protein
MSETPGGQGRSTDTTDAHSGNDLVDGTTGDDARDAGDEDTTLTTDDAAQRDNDVAQPGND